jgi:hypothetical protein
VCAKGHVQPCRAYSTISAFSCTNPLPGALSFRGSIRQDYIEYPDVIHITGVDDGGAPIHKFMYTLVVGRRYNYP